MDILLLLLVFVLLILHIVFARGNWCEAEGIFFSICNTWRTWRKKLHKWSFNSLLPPKMYEARRAVNLNNVYLVVTNDGSYLTSLGICCQESCCARSSFFIGSGTIMTVTCKCYSSTRGSRKIAVQIIWELIKVRLYFGMPWRWMLAKSLDEVKWMCHFPHVMERNLIPYAMERNLDVDRSIILSLCDIYAFGCMDVHHHI